MSRPLEQSYAQYLKGFLSPVSEICILDVGGGESSPILQDCRYDREAKHIRYWNLSVPIAEGRDDLASLRTRVREQIARAEEQPKHHDYGYRGAQVRWDSPFEWNGSDVPYPFRDGSFDEIHCHMIQSPVVHPSHPEFDLPTGDEYVVELTRLTRPQGRFFLSSQVHSFFGDKSWSEFVESVESFVSKLERRGFAIDVAEYNHSSPVKEKEPHIPSERGSIKLDELHLFSNYAKYADMFVIATKK